MGAAVTGHMAKHEKREEPRIIRIQDYQKPGGANAPGASGKEDGGQEEEARAVIEYGGEEEEGESPVTKKGPRPAAGSVPKAVYQVAVVLVVLVVGLAVWMNRTNLSPENIGSWLKLQVTGADTGDGFPVQITGSEVLEANFLAYGGNAVALSDTALCVLDSTGREEASLRHSLNNPVLQAAGGRFLLYNSGSTGYMTLLGGDTVVNAVEEKDILAGAIAQNGRFALGVQGSNGASELHVYQKDGSLQYRYSLAWDYITAVALNYDGAYGAVCTVRSDKGTLVSKVIIFDFTNPEPIAEYETGENLLVAACWGEDGSIYAVGDTALLMAGSSDYQFREYNYQGRQLTAFQLGAGRAFLSVSAYGHAGPSTLLVYALGQEEPVRVEADNRIESISVYGGSVGLLVGEEALFYDYSTGALLGRAQAGGDAKALALLSESAAYVLGVSEVRAVRIS